MGGEATRITPAGEPWLRMEVRVPLGAIELDVRLASSAAVVALVGPSGSGKSTLIRVLAGVEARARGVVEVQGRRWQDPGGGTVVPPWARRVGWVPQESLLFPHLSVRENLAYAGPPAGEVEEVARLLRIDGLLDRRPRRLRGGERQRVALGRALLAQPRLLLLDEPFSALDRPLREELAGTVATWLQEAGVPAVLVSHDEEDARIVGAERWLLVDGRVRPLGPHGGGRG